MSKRKHFIGIGGIGVSALARYCLAKGYTVSGSDVTPCPELEKEGIIFYNKHEESNITEEVEEVVYSSAITSGNPEVERAKELGIEIRSYPEALGELTKEYFTVAVSGTHGKSTTTGMLSLVMMRGGFDPTIILGTKMKELGNKNYRVGESSYLLIEADEYKEAFLNYFPEVAVITNIEEDHLDYYRDLNHILSSFKQYAKENVKKILILNGDNECAVEVGGVAEEKDVYRYSLKDEVAKEIKLSVPGKHNLQNALAACKAGECLGMKKEKILEVLREFKGTWRRFDEEVLKLKNGKKVKIINDYAHHPTAVKATLEAIKEKYPREKLVLVFQPHQYERTYKLFSSFKKVLSEIPAEDVFITDIYTVEGRESPEIVKKTSGEKLAKEVEGAVYTGDLKKTRDHLLKNLQGEEILIIMGAGDVYNLGGYIKKGL